MPVFDAELAAFRRALRGQFTLERELGRGGMGVVFLARDVKLERLAAIKVLPPDHGGRDDTRERFLREARLAAQLSHPNIVPVFRADEVDGFAYFVMAYVDGESLAERMRTRGPLPLAETVRYLREVAWALAYAHARGVVHRDVKPENILVESGSGRALVTDFGIARDAAATSITATGNVLGTVHYMSPEQIAGDPPLDGRSDLYSLGVVGYYLLSGKLPFAGPSASAVLLAHATRPAPPLATVAPDVPPRIAAIIDRCLTKNRDDRYETGESLADMLGKAWSAVEAEQLIATPSGQRSFSEPEAMSLWRRAAQLQADAARRLEQRTRSSTDLVAPASSPDPTQAFRLRDIERAAVEAGISRQFIAMAVAEARPEPTAKGAPPEKADDLLSKIVRTDQRSVSVSRVIRAQPSKVLLSLGRVFQTSPFDLQLHEIIGPHPLDGGILVFDVPKMRNDGTTHWVATRYGCFIKQVRVTLHRVPNDPDACEVQIHGDLRRGVRTRTKAGGALGGLFTSAGGVLSTIVAANSSGIVGLTGIALGAAGWGLTLLVAGAMGLGYTSMFPRALKRAEAEFDAALRAVERALFSNDVFGEPPPARGVPSPAVSSSVVIGARIT